MLSTCANPACRAPFQYLREGRLYKFEVHSGTTAVTNRKPPRKVEHFWLCGECATTMTLTLGEHHKVEITPRKNVPLRRAAAS